MGAKGACTRWKRPVFLGGTLCVEKCQNITLGLESPPQDQKGGGMTGKSVYTPSRTKKHGNTLWAGTHRKKRHKKKREELRNWGGGGWGKPHQENT